ncbi:hypothetical protein HZB05_02890 [Candidatus Wolfebacteria bacterium]|nr:hypothetical protein [Candidatus Wolfebacteria bacterium]
MSPIKIISVFFIINVGIISAYLIINNSIAPAVNADKNTNNQTESQSLGANPFQLIGDLAANKNSNESSDSQKDSNIQTNINPVNFTQIIAQSLFKGIKTLDQNGTNPFGSVDPNDPKTKEVIQKSINELSSVQFGVSISDSDLKISSDNSQKAKTAYLTDVRNIFNQKLTNQKFLINSPEDIINDVNDDCFFKTGSSLSGQRADFFQSLAGEYKKLSVPSDWLDFHKKLLNFYDNAQLIFRAFSECANDPAKVYVISEKFPSAVFEDMSKLQELFIQKYREVGLDYFKIIYQ